MSDNKKNENDAGITSDINEIPKEKTGMVLGHDVVIKVINGNRGKAIKKLMKKIDDENKKDESMFGFVTTMNTILHGIYKAEPDTPIKHLQNLIDTVTIAPSDKDKSYKDEKYVMEELVTLAKILSDPQKVFEEMGMECECEDCQKQRQDYIG